MSECITHQATAEELEALEKKLGPIKKRTTAEGRNAGLLAADEPAA